MVNWVTLLFLAPPAADPASVDGRENSLVGAELTGVEKEAAGGTVGAGGTSVARVVIVVGASVGPCVGAELSVVEGEASEGSIGVG